MRDNEYDYEYFDVASDADFIDDECYYDDGTDEPWVDAAEATDQDDYTDYMNKYNSYYHDVADEIDD